MLTRLHWDVKEYKKQHFPVKVTCCPDLKLEFNGTRVLDMPVYMHDQGWHIPDSIQGYKSLIESAKQHEMQYYHDVNVRNNNDEKTNQRDVKFRYIYITIDQRVVQPGQCQRRPGYHADSFAPNLDKACQDKELVDHTYIYCDALPTEFISGPFEIEQTMTDEEVLAVFEKQSVDKNITTAGTHCLLMLTPFVIHRTAINHTQLPIPRTFVKISFSTKQFRREGNTHNDLFDYAWEMKPRSCSQRNHPFVSN
jgi:hypothetical protein